MAAAAIITSLAPLAEQLISAAIAYENARSTAAASTAPTAAQLASLAVGIEQTDSQIVANANAETGSGAPSA